MTILRVRMPHRLTLTEMAALIRRRKLSPAELLEAHLRQIEKHEPNLNAFVERFEDAALETGSLTRPLHGIPLTIKDSFDIRGRPTLCGSQFRRSHVAAADSTAARRLREAGAVLLGKTNCPESLANWETDNRITGRTNNPWDLERTAGGSSGGESAAISAFCSAGGVGSDGGGSVRIPAHFCGISALKPTPGRVPATGHSPAISHPGGLLGVAGPMARTVEDVGLLFEILAGHDPADPFSAPVPLRRDAADPDCIGVMEQFLDDPVQPCMREAVREAARLFETCGLRTDEFRPVGLEEARRTWWFFFGEVAAEFNRDVVAGREEEAAWTGLELLNMVDPEQRLTGRQVVEQLMARDRMRAALFAQMERFPVLLLPVCAVAAFRHRERGWEIEGKRLGLLDIMAPVTPWNLLGMPALTVPLMLTAEGLPVGVQLVARPYEEELLLHVGAKLEEARGRFPAPPGY